MTTAEYINKIGPIIQRFAKAGGYQICSTVIAQAILESNWGRSSLAATYHNHFGMKAGSKWTGNKVKMTTYEEVAGKMVKTYAYFRSYNDLEEGVAGYYQFIKAARYQNLKTAKTYKEYAMLIKADGWATATSYVNSLIRLVEQYHLDEWDTGTPGRTDETVHQVALDVIRGKYGNGSDRKKRLAAAGYDPSVIQKEVNRILKK